ncbi:MAG: T9SS type A sorting domain-containing protein, partial [Bacteroidota bacterium]
VNLPLTASLSLTSLTLSAAGQLTITGTGSSSINFLNGGITMNSNNPLSLTAGSGNINFTSNNTIAGSGSGNISLLGTVVVNNGGQISTTKNINFGNLNLIGSGNYRFNASGLTASFTGTISGAGSFLPFGNDASFNFTGTGTVGTLKANAAINNLTINTPATTSTLLSTLRVLGTVTITDGTLNSNGFLILASTANRQGIISGTGTASVTGNVTVERFLSSSQSKTRYISCPVTGLTTTSAWGDDYIVQGLFPYTYATNVALPTIPNAPTIWTYDESNVLPLTPWESAVGQPITNSLVGYAASLHNTLARTLDVTGPANNGALSISLPATTGGWHLLGNPYPSPIRFSLLRNLAGQIGLQNGYYGWSAANNGFGFYNGAAPALSTFGMTDTIFSSQSVAITLNTPAGGTLITDNSIRWGSNAPTFNREAEVKNILKLNIENQDGADQLAIGTVAGAIEGYNPEIDMAKMMNTPTENLPELGMMIDNRVIAIKTYEKLIPSRSIPLQLIAKTDGVYTFKVAEFGNTENDLNAYLVDIVANKKIKLKANAKYTLALAADVYQNRFYLNYENSKEVLGLEDASAQVLDCFNTNEILSISNSGDAQNAGLMLFDLSGKVVLENAITVLNGITTVQLPALAQGMYTVKIQSNNSLLTKKIIIK